MVAELNGPGGACVREALVPRVTSQVVAAPLESGEALALLKSHGGRGESLHGPAKPARGVPVWMVVLPSELKPLDLSPCALKPRVLVPAESSVRSS